MFYARIITVVGGGVDRRTNNYTTIKGLERAIKATIKCIKSPGPYMVERYVGGERAVSFDS